ncbi:hypothetical protein UT300005_16330 [Clostridium sp. CTA-5]
MLKYTDNYRIINSDIASGGFPSIIIEKKVYIIIDCNKNILLLRNNILSSPSNEEKIKILKFYKKYNLLSL